MAQRTAGVLLGITPLRQSEEEEAIPASARDFASDRAQRAVASRIVFKSLVEDLHHDLPMVESPRKQRPGCGQSPVPRGSGAIYSSRNRGRRIQKALRSADTKIGILGNARGSMACSFPQVSFGTGLQAPSDAPEQKRFVKRLRLLPAYLPVFGSQGGDVQVPQLFDCQNDRWIHSVFLSPNVNHSSMNALC